MNFLFSVPRWWILHVPRGWQETRGHCSGKIFGTPGRPEQTNTFHQVGVDDMREDNKRQYGNVCVSGSVWPVTGETAPPPTCLSPSSFRTSMTTRPCFNLKVCIIALQHPWYRTGRLLLHRNSLDIQHSRAQCVKSEDKTRRGGGGRNILCKLIRRQYTGIVSHHCQQEYWAISAISLILKHFPAADN